MEFTFDYKPEAKQRPRFGEKGKVYNPQRKKELGYKWEAARQMRLQSPERPLESPISVNMTYHMPMPKSWSQKRKKEQFGKPMTSKPDIDNLMKWSLDVLNGIAYVDDKFVSSTCSEKVWDYDGKVHISIQPHEMSLQEEIQMLGKYAVEFHEALDYIYQWTIKLQKYPISNEALVCSKEIIKKCLDAGLYEIYGEKNDK